MGDATVGKTHLLSRYVKSRLPKARAEQNSTPNALNGRWAPVGGGAAVAVGRAVTSGVWGGAG